MTQPTDHETTHRALALIICRALMMIVQALNKYYDLKLRLKEDR